MKPPFNFLNIVAEIEGRGHTEVTVCMYGQHPQENIDGPDVAAIPAHGRITREKNAVFPVPVRASEIGFCVSPSTVHSTLDHNAVSKDSGRERLAHTTPGRKPLLT